MAFNAIVLINILLAVDLSHQVSIYPRLELNTDTEVNPDAEWLEDIPSGENHKYPQTNKLDHVASPPLHHYEDPEIASTVNRVLSNINQYLEKNDEEAPRNVESNLILCRDPACEIRFLYPIDHVNMGEDAPVDGVVPVDFQKKAQEINRRFSKSNLYKQTPTALTTTQEPKIEKDPKNKGLMHAFTSKFKKLITFKKFADGVKKKVQ